jgi:hypothetical protein
LLVFRLYLTFGMFVVLVIFVCALPVASGAIVLRVPISVHSKEFAFLSVMVKGDEIGVYFSAPVLARGARVLSWPL